MTSASSVKLGFQTCVEWLGDVLFLMVLWHHPETRGEVGRGCLGD